MKKILGLSLLSILLSACQTHVVKLGTPGEFHPATSPHQVAVYYKEFPTCKYKEIALLDNPFGDWQVYSNLQQSVDDVKAKAAAEGADFIRIGDWSRWPWNDKKVNYAIAYKCVK